LVGADDSVLAEVDVPVPVGVLDGVSDPDGVVEGVAGVHEGCTQKVVWFCMPWMQKSTRDPEVVAMMPGCAAVTLGQLFELSLPCTQRFCDPGVFESDILMQHADVVNGACVRNVTGFMNGATIARVAELPMMYAP
jgi:hypothetical protein